MNTRPMHLAERIVRYGVSGVSISVVYTLLVIALVHALPKFAPTGDAAIAFLLVQPVGLLLHGTITYPETGQACIHLPQIGLRFVVTNAAGFIVATGGMAVITSVLHDSYLWGIALTWVLVPALNFVVYLVWVFRPATLRGNRETSLMAEQYNEAFYDRTEQSAAAAAAIVAILQPLAPIGSVLDVGCARGTWLAAWQAAGCGDVIGIDGGQGGRERLLIPPDRFIQTDLSRPFNLGRRFDLVQCLEVAEHLPPARSAGLVDDLTAHSGMVLFSAAPPGQGGECHINEQPYEFWRGLFAARGYAAFDCVRPMIAARRAFPYWYRYNMLLYVHTEAAAVVPPGRLPPAEPVPDVSPLLFRLRKKLFQTLPQSIIEQLAALNTRLTNAR